MHQARLATLAAFIVPIAIVSMLLSESALDAAWAASANAPRSDRAKCDRARFRVVVDAGHSAEVPGAMSARGVPEHAFNLRLANRIGQRLIRAGFARTVVLVTPGPATRGLVERVGRANTLPADLFLSIHHDSVPEWLLETWEYEGRQYRFSDRFKGHSIFVSQDSSQWAASLAFAQLLGNQLKARGLQYAPHYTEAIMGYRRRELLDAKAGVYRYDQLVVLRQTNMPAILLEAGSIINREEELLMATPARQSLISAAVTEAVEAFCSWRPGSTQASLPVASPRAQQRPNRQQP